MHGVMDCGLVQKQRVKQDLERKYGIKEKGIHTVIEIVKQRILAKATKLKRYKGRKAQFDDNHLFNTNQRRPFVIPGIRHPASAFGIRHSAPRHRFDVFQFYNC